MAQKSKGTAKAVVLAKLKAKPIPKVQQPILKAKGEKTVAAKAVIKVTGKVAAKTQPPAVAPVAVKAQPPVKTPQAKAKVQPAITMAKEALKATVKAEKAEKPARSRKISVSASATEAASALAQKWISLFKKAEQIEAKPYNMKAVFDEKTAIVHKVLGWGYILANRNDRLEVLFKDGIKYLISNYKP